MNNERGIRMAFLLRWEGTVIFIGNGPVPTAIQWAPGLTRPFSRMVSRLRSGCQQVLSFFGLRFPDRFSYSLSWSASSCRPNPPSRPAVAAVGESSGPAPCGLRPWAGREQHAQKLLIPQLARLIVVLAQQPPGAGTGLEIPDRCRLITGSYQGALVSRSSTYRCIPARKGIVVSGPRW